MAVNDWGTARETRYAGIFARAGPSILGSGKKDSVRYLYCGEACHIKDSCRHSCEIQCYSCEGWGHKAQLCCHTQGRGKEEVAENANPNSARNCYPDPSPVAEGPSTCTACNEDLAADVESDSITRAKEFVDHIPFCVNNRKNIQYCQLNIKKY